MKKLKWWGGLLMIGLASLFPGVVTAQDTDQCPQRVLVALARAGAVCQRIEHEQACYGYGSVAATFTPGSTEAIFDTVGDFTAINALRELRVHSTDMPDWSLAMFHIQADLVDLEQRSIVFLLFGDAVIINQVPYTPEIMIRYRHCRGGVLGVSSRLDGAVLWRISDSEYTMTIESAVVYFLALLIWVLIPGPAILTIIGRSLTTGFNSSVPIRLTPIPTTCRMLPHSRI